MINRTVWQCDSCRTRTIVRIGFGHGSAQRHAFPCPTCGVELEVVLHIDQQRARWRYERGKNATQVAEEDGAVAVRTFYPGIMVPDRDDGFVSPFVETILNVEDLDGFGADETGRQIIIRELWPKLERAHVHFERDNGDLFDRELQGVLDLPASTSRAQRADRLAFVTQRAFAQFTQSTDGQRQRVRQRLTLAQSIDPNLMAQIATKWLDSGRMSNLWTQVRALRAEVITAYALYRSVLQMMKYWGEADRKLDGFVIPDKGFDALKSLYIDTYETLCRLVVLIVVVEAVIHHRTIDIPTRKGSMTAEEYEEMKNGLKPDILNKYPIADLFAPAMDSVLRNGIGHNAARYDGDADEIVYTVQGKGEIRMAYTAFVARVLETYSEFELASKYFHVLHGRVAGQLQP
jgi:hypothetical protein